MRPFVFLSVLLSTSFLGGVAMAQNYVQARNYNNPDVVVNMDALGISNSPYRQTPSYQSPNAPVLAPVLNRPLPPLRPPVANPQLADKPPMPITPAPVRNELAPAAPAMGNFSARAMAMTPPVALPPPAPLAPQPIETVAEAPVKEIKKQDKNEPARELLAAARSEAASEKPRDVVIFDEAPAAPAKKEAVVKEEPKIAAAEELKPVPLPTDKLDEPKDVKKASAAPMDLTTPPSMIKEIAAEETAKPAAMPEKVETAMLKPEPITETAQGTSGTSGATLVDDFEAYRLLFGAKSAELTATETAVLDKIIGKLKSEPATRLQLRAYADGTPDTASGARRLSLSRALQVRSYLTQKGVTASRLDVRALGLGNAAMGDAVNRDAIPADRVDVIFVR